MSKEVSEINRKNIGKIIDGTSKGAVIGGIIGSCVGPLGTVACSKAGAYVGAYVGSLDAFDAWDEAKEMREDFTDLCNDIGRDIAEWWNNL
ncbi:hypothetical protein EZY14_004210 [Kordia sp. TARA_039_SRF]|nr:hypothetical protein EZY14_004210 [Kordia sp. TARA_039_SRF]